MGEMESQESQWTQSCMLLSNLGDDPIIAIVESTCFVERNFIREP